MISEVSGLVTMWNGHSPPRWLSLQKSTLINRQSSIDSAVGRFCHNLMVAARVLKKKDGTATQAAASSRCIAALS